MRLITATVLSNETIMPATHLLELQSPLLGQAAQPGQFLHIRPTSGWDPLLRRPMSIFRIRPEGVSLLVRDVGRGSAIIANSAPGSHLDCLGPLGRGFELDGKARHLLMVGGGYGAAPLIALAERAIPRGAEVALLVGAATAEHVYPADRLPSAIEYYTATVDGTLGSKGLVTQLIPDLLDWADAVYACGPKAMLRAVAEVCRIRPALPVQLAMEQHMGCAMGVCLGCVTETVAGYRRVCRDGPVFRADEIVWS